MRNSDWDVLIRSTGHYKSELHNRFVIAGGITFIFKKYGRQVYI